MTRILIVLVLLALTSGCGSRRPEADVERGRRGVTAALDSWKAGEPPTKLKSLPDPVEFAEEMRSTHALTDYTLGRVDASDPDVIRYAVTLKLKDKKGKSSEREVVYGVAFKNAVVVSRDPYY